MIKISNLDLDAIIEGHAKEIFNLEEDLYNKRIKICRECSLYDKTLAGEVCSSKKYYNPNTGTVSNFPCGDCQEGCGCRLSAKLRLVNANCVLGKW